MRRCAVFRATPAGLEQRILLAGDIDWPDPETVAPPDVEAVALPFGHAAFDLAQGPLFRFKLLCLGQDDHLLLCGFHHPVIDGQSWQIFVDELALCLADGRVLPATAGYADYCEWQRVALADGRWAAARSYWQGVYEAAPAVWALPLDHPRPQQPDRSGRALPARLPPATAGRLRTLAAVRGISPFRVAFAAFFAFLYRISGESDLLVPTTLIGRGKTGFTDVIGLFANPGGIRLRIEEDTRFCRLLAALDAQLDAAVAHEDYPFNLAVGTLHRIVRRAGTRSLSASQKRRRRACGTPAACC
jgi:hypothetical protein